MLCAFRLPPVGREIEVGEDLHILAGDNGPDLAGRNIGRRRMAG